MDCGSFYQCSSGITDDEITEALLREHREDANAIDDSTFYDVFAGHSMSMAMINNVAAFNNGRVTDAELRTLVISSAINLRAFACVVRARCRPFELHLQSIDEAGPLAHFKDFFAPQKSGLKPSEQPQGTFIRNSIAHGDFELIIEEKKIVFGSGNGNIQVDALFFFNDVCTEIFRYFRLLYSLKSAGQLVPSALK